MFTPADVPQRTNIMEGSWAKVVSPSLIAPFTQGVVFGWGWLQFVTARKESASRGL